MATIRRFEERVQEEFSKGGIPGFVHLYAGEEAAAVGVCSHLGPRDYIASTHRGHGHSIAKGCDPVLMMQELFAKKGGLCGGKGGSMHIADLDRGMLGANGIVGGGPPLVVGAALTAKTLGRGTVAVSFTGDGGSNQGTTFEAMNMAVVLKLPAIFVFENNQYGEGTAYEYGRGGSASRHRRAEARCLRLLLRERAMALKSIRQALNEALAQEMRRDPRVVVIGEDVAGGAGSQGQRDAYGGVLGVTKGLFGEFGQARVIDTPITESAIMGAAAGAAVTGLRPVAELMFSDFFGVCFDQIYNQAAKFRYMFGGKAKTPLVIRTMIGAGRSAAAQHSQSPYHIFTAVPGLKCVVPSNAYDAKGLLIQAIRDDDPVIFCEHKLMYDLRAEVPDEPYTIPFGEANIVRDGDDVTVVALSRMVHYAGEAIDTLAKEGIEIE